MKFGLLVCESGKVALESEGYQQLLMSLEIQAKVVIEQREDLLGTIVDEINLVLEIHVVSPVRNLSTPLQAPVTHDWGSRLVVDVERRLVRFLPRAKGSRQIMKWSEGDGR
jgi:hypothetical protein